MMQTMTTYRVQTHHAVKIAEFPDVTAASEFIQTSDRWHLWGIARIDDGRGHALTTDELEEVAHVRSNGRPR